MSTSDLDYAQDCHEEQEDLSKRRRVARACDQCRKKKIRCDGEKTCNNCLAYKTECVFTKTVRKRASPRGAKYIASLEERLEKMEQLLQSKIPEDEPGPLQPHLVDREETSLMKAVHSSSMSEPKNVVEGGGDEADKEAIALAEQMGYLMVQHDGEPEYIGASGSATMIVTSQQKISEILGDSSFAQCCANTQQRVEASQYRDHLHYKDLMLQSCPKPERPSFPDIATCDRYINLYFSHVHPIYPFLDKRDFLRNAQLMLDTSREIDWAFNGIYMMVLAFGSHIAEGSLPGRIKCEGSNLYAYAHRLSFHIAEKISLHALHAMLLVAHYLEVSNRTHLLWTLLGTTIRMAQSLGLHRKLRLITLTADQKAPNAAKMEIRRRTFWTIYTMDSNLVTATGKPAGIQDFDCDQELPTATPEELLYTNGALFCDGTPFSFFLAQVQLARISQRAQRDLYSVAALSLDSDELLDRTLRLDAELLHWAENLPEEFRPESLNPGLGMIPLRAYQSSVPDTMKPEVLLALVHLRYFNSMSTIHRRNTLTAPVPGSRHTSPTSPPPASRVDASLSIAIHASRCCLGIISTDLPRMHAAGVKINLLYPVSAVLVLFTAILRSPASPTVTEDIQRIRAVTNAIQTCDLEIEVQLGILADFFEQVVRVANIAAAQSSAQGAKRGWQASDLASQQDYPSTSTEAYDAASTSTYDGMPYNTIHNMQGGPWVPTGGLYAPELFADSANLLGPYPALQTSLLGVDARYNMDTIDSLNDPASLYYGPTQFPNSYQYEQVYNQDNWQSGMPNKMY